MIKQLASALAFAALLAPIGADAAVITQRSGFGDLNSVNACKFGDSVAPFQTGTVQSGGDMSGSCVGYFSVAIDTSAKTITLKGLEYGNYESGYVSITGISEFSITGLSTLSYLGLFDVNHYGDPSTYGGTPAPVLSFTADSLYIGFSTFGGSPQQFTYDGNGGEAVFSFATGEVPEPHALALIGLGLLGLSISRTRKR